MEYFVEKKPVLIGELENSIKAYQLHTQELTIVLYVDRTVAIENVVQVMDIANRLKIKLVLATEPKTIS